MVADGQHEVSQWLRLALVFTFAVGCTGTIADPGASGSGTGSRSGAGTGSTGGPSNGTAGTGGGMTTIPGVFTPAGSRLRRLTVLEYRNSVTDLLGLGTQVTTEFEKDTAYNNLTAVAASTIALSASITEQFETSALALAGSLARDTARRQRVVGCAPTGATDEACLRTFITNFGRRVFRRPLSVEEVNLYAGVGKNAMTVLADFWRGVDYVLAGFLQSPNFLYRTEIGVADASAPGGRVLDPYELASRLSYLLWATTPDDALLDAAAASSLSTPAGLQQQAERLLASPRLQDTIVDVFSQMLRLAELDTLSQSPTLFSQVASPTLGASMRTETQNVLRDMFARNGDYRELFTTTQTSLNAELASLYGVPAPTGTQFAPTTLPANGPRAGYLGQASFLALNAHPDGTSPTLRGKFIVETLLCNSIPPPPNDVVTEIPDQDKSKTKREQLQIHQALPSCAACHTRMDPLGLALEHFDGIGAYRETDRGMALDVTGTLGGMTFNGLRELGQVLANGLKTPENNLQTADCLVRNLFRVATGHLERTGDLPVIAKLSTAFTADAFRVRGMLAKLVASDAFRFVGQPE
jgi:hypothetical protein